MKRITEMTLRQKLPGFRREETLASEYFYEGKKKRLVYVFEIRGCFDELLTVQSFQIRNIDGSVESYSTLQEAVARW